MSDQTTSPSGADVTPPLNDGDLRMLGARDGMVTALLAVRREIGRLTYRPIKPRHTRQIAERERLLAPLRALDRELTEHIESVRAAYEATRESRINAPILESPSHAV